MIRKETSGSLCSLHHVNSDGGCCHSIRDPIAFRARYGLLERAFEDPVQTIEYLRLLPEQSLEVLHPFEIADDDSPELQRISGKTKISSPRVCRIASASGVVGPFAPSARTRHLSCPAFRPVMTCSIAAGMRTSHF